MSRRLALKWQDSREFLGWISTLSQDAEVFGLRVTPEFIATALSIGIELGYELRVQTAR